MLSEDRYTTLLKTYALESVFGRSLPNPPGLDGSDDEDSILQVYSDFDLLALPDREAAIASQLCWDVNEEFVVCSLASLCRSVNEAPFSRRDHARFFGSTRWLSLSGSQSRLPYWCHKS